MAENTSESRDGTGAGGDHDVAYVFGSPAMLLTTRAQARLLLLRTALRNGERTGDTAAGDSPLNPTVEDVPLG